MAKETPPPPTSSSTPFLGVPADPSYLPPPYILLPLYPRRLRRPRRPDCCFSLFSSSSLLALAALLLLLLSLAFFAWPSDPDLQVARLDLDRFRLVPPPRAALDVALALTLKVRNPDFYALDYRSVNVSISYRGRPLGSMRTGGGGHIRARGVSYVDADVRLDGIELLSDVVYLVEDLARGSLPLDTVTVIDGTLRLFFVSLPVKGKVSCAVLVNPQTQKVIRQDCYPE